MRSLPFPISGFILTLAVFLFTFALFLSGYVLQQQTLRDIRTAIKPPPVTVKEHVYSPKQFEEPRIPVSGEANEVVVNVKRDLGPANAKPTRRKKGTTSQYKPEAKQRVEGDQTVVVEDTLVRPDGSDGPPLDSAPVGNLEGQTDEKPLSKAARRKKIREEILADGDGESFKGYRRRVVS